MDTVKDALAFYREKYQLLGNWIQKPGIKIVLGSHVPSRCRFCGKSSPEVTFRLDAHAIPESIGNRTLLSHYECDTCNKFFGDGIENDLGNWSKPMRTLQRIRGKRGVPTLKSEASGWRIECDASGQFNVNHDVISDVFTVFESEKRINFKLKRDPHTPIAVLKAFVKIGLSLMPDEEMPSFSDALAWIRNPHHGEEFELLAPVSHAFCAGPAPSGWLSAAVLRRKSTSGNVPYAFLILEYANEMFQVMLPCPAHDSGLAGGSLPLFPATPVNHWPVAYETVDLSGTDLVTDEVVSVDMTFEEMKAISPEPENPST